MSEWFYNEDFWSVYGQLMFEKDRIAGTGGEVEKLIKLAGIKDESVILDSCCGMGRHSIEFAKRGHIVTGVDITENYLETAKKDAKAAGVSAEFVKSDVREFIQPGKFDLAVNLYTSFGYFEDPEDEEKTVKNIYKSLKPGGKFVIDTIGKEVLAKNFEEPYWFEKEGKKILVEYKIHNNWTRLENRWIIIDGETTYDHSFEQTIYSAAELGRLLWDCGFEHVEFYGSLEGTPYDITAKRLIAVAVKTPD